ncbi:MAG: flagellar hook-length control protein FliK [Rhodanobacter sp.]|nr:MAG: flagellar hook-length control protein FliK [Rhodanobacter sp.]
MTATAAIAATTAIVSSKPTGSSATVASRASGTGDPGDSSSTPTPKQFDHQLGAARKQQGLAREAASAAKPDSAKVDGKSEQPATDAKTKDKPQPDPTATGLVGAMLAFVSPPLKPGDPPSAAGSWKSGGTEAETRGAKGSVMVSGANTPMLPQSGASNMATGVAAQLKTAGVPQALAGVTLPRKDVGPESSVPAFALPAATPSAMPPTMHLLQLPSPVASHAFGHELAQQVTWLGGQDLKQARIRLHPEELGQLEVKVNVTHGQVDVVFSAQHPAAVAAVQQSLPQLGHLLAQHGLNLGHAEVGQHSHGDRSARHGGSRGVSSIDADEGSAAVFSSSPAAVGLLDAFA